MIDDRHAYLDQRLHADGARWRAATDVDPEVPTPHPSDRGTDFGLPVRRSRSTALAVAASVAVILTLAAAVLVWRQHATTSTATRQPGASTTVAPVVLSRLRDIAVTAARRQDAEIATAQAVLTRADLAAELTYGSAQPSDGTVLVWVIQIKTEAPFVCRVCHGPVGSKPITGSVMTITLDRDTYNLRTSGITNAATDLTQLGAVVTLVP